MYEYIKFGFARNVVDWGLMIAICVIGAVGYGIYALNVWIRNLTSKEPS